MVEKFYNLYAVKFYVKKIWTPKTGFSHLYSPKRTNVRLTGNKDLCGCLCLSSSVASETLEYSSISWLQPAHRQPGCCGDFVAGVGQFGKRHRVFKPLYLGLGHTYTFSRIRKVSGGTKKNISLFNKSMDNPYPYFWANFTTSLKQPTHIAPICLCYPSFFRNMHVSIMTANYALIGWHGWMCAGGKRGPKTLGIKVRDSIFIALGPTCLKDLKEMITRWLT